MLVDDERDGRKMVIVVLDGIRASTQKNGVAPLRCALRDVVAAEDEVLVLTVFNSAATTPSPNVGYCCLGENRIERPGGEGYSDRFLHEEMKQRTEDCMKIFRPFYDKCKSNGVKFVVKIAAGFQLPSARIVEEANNAGATWIVMDRCFARDSSFNLSGANCNISLVSDDEDHVVNNYMPLNDGSEASVLMEVKPKPISSKLKQKSHSQQEEPYMHSTLPNLGAGFQPFDPSLLASTSGEGEGEILNMAESSEEIENFGMVETPTMGTVLDDNISSRVFSLCNYALRMPLRLTWEMISEMTCGFKEIICVDKNQRFQMFCGYLSDCQTRVAVKRFIGDFSGILEAEKKAALAMYHKNILGLIGYHQNENATVLVFPYTRLGTLDKFLYGASKTKAQLAFQDKMKIAIGIAQGLQYMHEECPRGPIVHGNLWPCNIFLRHDLQPQITGFDQATWLQLEHSSPISNNRSGHKDLSDKSLALVKSDILSFGILLLRLFCRRSAPRDNNDLVEWARPLLRERAYPKLFEEDMDYLDTYGIFRVTSVAAQCIKAKQISRPCMNKVVSYLKGEISCAVESSPSSEGSPSMDFNMYLAQSLNVCWHD